MKFQTIDKDEMDLKKLESFFEDSPKKVLKDQEGSNEIEKANDCRSD